MYLGTIHLGGYTTLYTTLCLQNIQHHTLKLIHHTTQLPSPESCAAALRVPILSFDMSPLAGRASRHPEAHDLKLSNVQADHRVAFV